MEDKVLKALEETREAINSKFDGLDGKMQDIEKRLVSVEDITRNGGVSLPGVEQEKQKFSFAKAFYAIASGDWSNAGFEKEVFDNTREKQMSTTSDGAFMVPSEYIAEIIELLRAKAVVIGLGATVMDGLTGAPVEIPRQSSGSTA